MATTWNPADKQSTIVLSNGNLTATFGTTNGTDCLVRATASQSSGKWVVGFVAVHTATGADHSAVGISPASQALADWQYHAGIGFDHTGAVVVANTSAGTVSSYVDGNSILMAFDLSNKLLWIKVASGNWNNSGTANPDTGAGGISFSGYAGSSTLFPAVSLGSNSGGNESYTIDGAATGHGLTTFTAWDGVTGVSGALATTEAADTAAFAGTVVVFGPLVATEGADTASFAALTSAFGALVSTEGADTASMSGLMGLIGPLATTEAADTATMAGQVVTSGPLVVTEAADTAAFAGQVVSGVSGGLSATEAADTAAFTAQTVTSGALDATEATDTAAFLASVPASGFLAATEAADLAIFVGSIPTTWEPQPPVSDTWTPQDAVSPSWASQQPAAGNWSPT